jgi:hypothetical protein
LGWPGSKSVNACFQQLSILALVNGFPYHGIHATDNCAFLFAFLGHLPLAWGQRERTTHERAGFTLQSSGFKRRDDSVLYFSF